MRPFDTVIVVDWSASAAPSPARPSPDAIWIGVASARGEFTTYHRTRAAAECAVAAILDAEAQAGRRVLAGFDFPFGYPHGFAEMLTGTPGAAAVWHWLADHISDDANNRNTRFALAAAINRRFPAPGPFWGRPRSQPHPDLSETKPTAYSTPAERRRVEKVVPRAQPVWKLFTTGSVGSQALTGLPMIARLSQRPGTTVWPFAAPDGPLVLAEVYPSLLDAEVRAAGHPGSIKDELQVRLLARAMHHLAQTGGLDQLLADVPDWPGRADEGWILGAGQTETLRGALR